MYTRSPQSRLSCHLIFLLGACGSCKSKEIVPPPPPPPPPPPTLVDSVRVEPPALNLSIGEQARLTAVALDKDGRMFGERPAQWTSSAPSVATVEGGRVVGVAAGQATITATIDRVSGSSVITVVDGPPAPVASIDVSPAQLTLQVGETQQFMATPRDAQGNPLQRPITWSSASPSVASVDQMGRVFAQAEGSATIRATSQDVTSEARLTVEAVVQQPSVVTINLNEPLQTMIGLEAVPQIGDAECPREAFDNYKSAMLDRAADELGLDRIRLEVRSGAENPADHYGRFLRGKTDFGTAAQNLYPIVNDNNDPFDTNLAAFHFSELDRVINEVVNPMRSRLAAKGRDLYVVLTYVTDASTSLHRDDPNEYAEFILTTWQHIEQTYGWIPDGLEVALEPDQVTHWNNDQYKGALLAVIPRLQQAGYNPEIVGPSHANVFRAIEAFDFLEADPASAGKIDELAYHRYGGGPLNALHDVRDRILARGIRSGMTEHIGSDHLIYEEDLTEAHASVWTRLALGFCLPGDGGDYYYADITDPQNPVISLRPSARYMPQYSRTVHRGAVRYGVVSARGNLHPFAFRNADGRWSIVVRSTEANTFTIGGLPAGRYSTFYTTESELSATAPEITLEAGQALQANLPGAGVITVHQQ